MPEVRRLTGQASCLLAALLFTLAFAAGEAAKPLFPGARASIGGLTVTATLPKTHYGPGEAVRVYLTFRNGGRTPVLLGGGVKPTAVVLSEGKEMTFEQGPVEWVTPETSPSEDRLLRPGETATARFEMKPARKDLTQGARPIKVYCALDGTPAGAAKGVLASNEAKYWIKYDVLMVY